jgi:hypothetical protein
VVNLEDYNLELVVLTMNQVRPKELQNQWPIIPTKIANKENTWQRAFSGIF